MATARQSTRRTGQRTSDQGSSASPPGEPSPAEQRSQIVREALRDLDVVLAARPTAWQPDRDELELSLQAMLLHNMLGRLTWSFFGALGIGGPDDPDTRRIALELTYTVIDGDCAEPDRGLPALAADVATRLARLPNDLLFCPFVEWSARWLRVHPAPEDLQSVLARLPGLRWESCGLRLLRPRRGTLVGRARNGAVAIERHLYQREG